MPFLPPSPNESDDVSLYLILSQTHRIQKLEAVLGQQRCWKCEEPFNVEDGERLYPNCEFCRAIRDLLKEGK